MKNRQNIAYYHVYLDDDYQWASMFLDQMKMVEDSGLMDALESLFVFVAFPERNGYLKLELEQLCRLYPKIYHNVRFSTGETYTHSQIKFDVNMWSNNYNILYIHQKGVTSTERFLKQGAFSEYKNYHYWRKYQEWGCIENWKYAVDMLNSNFTDTVGCNFCEWPVPHYSGGFWWSTSEYIRTLPNPVENGWWDKLRSEVPDLAALGYHLSPEMWVCYPRNYDDEICNCSFHDYIPKKLHGNLAEELIERREYI